MELSERQLMANMYLDAAKDMFCAPCYQAGQNKSDVCLQNIDAQKCSCEKVEYLFSAAHEYYDGENN